METENGKIIPLNEKNRLLELQQFPIHPEEDEQQFDDITKLAASICQKPIAFITVIGEDKQWIKSSFGVKAKVTERRDSICQYTVAFNTFFEIKDTKKDKRSKDLPHVKAGPKLRFYAGVPLTTDNNLAIGSLCVADFEPGELTKEQRDALTVLSRVVVNLFQLKRSRADLLAAKIRADEAVLSKSDFLSTMSHEIRTPLNGIIGISHLMEDEFILDHQREYVQILKVAARNLMAIVNDILDYSKIEAGQIHLELITFNLVELITEIRNGNLIKANERKLTIRIRKDLDLPELVKGDPVRLSQILNNLVSNAVKFTEEGEVVIDVALVESDQRYNKVRFAIRDTGIGIPEDKQQALFKRFSQIDSSITRRYGGTGLGLAITKGLLELQNSRIQVASVEGKGSTFSFELVFPAVDADEFRATHQTFQFNPIEAEVLLAEDNEMNVMITRKNLERWGIKATVVSNGLEVLEMITKRPFDLVLMDLQMPFLDGYETTRQIRSIGMTRDDLPIIAFSASTLMEEKIRAIEAGMNDFITKPFVPKELYLKISGVLKTTSSS